MPEHAPILADRTALVDRSVTELSLLAKEDSPDAVVEVLFTRYEDEDAHILCADELKVALECQHHLLGRVFDEVFGQGPSGPPLVGGWPQVGNGRPCEYDLTTHADTCEGRPRGRGRARDVNGSVSAHGSPPAAVDDPLRIPLGL